MKDENVPIRPPRFVARMAMYQNHATMPDQSQWKLLKSKVEWKSEQPLIEQGYYLFENPETGDRLWWLVLIDV